MKNKLFLIGKICSNSFKNGFNIQTVEWNSYITYQLLSSITNLNEQDFCEVTWKNIMQHYASISFFCAKYLLTRYPLRDLLLDESIQSWHLLNYGIVYFLFSTLRLTLMLLVANFANTKWCKKLKNNWYLGTWVFIWKLSNEYQHDRV